MTEAAAFFFPAARASAGGLNAGSAPAGAAGRDQTFAAMLGPQAGEPAAAPLVSAAPAPPATGLAQPGALTPLLSAEGALSLSLQSSSALLAGLSPDEADASAQLTGPVDALVTSGLTVWPAGPLPQLISGQSLRLSGGSQTSLTVRDRGSFDWTGPAVTPQNDIFGVSDASVFSKTGAAPGEDESSAGAAPSVDMSAVGRTGDETVSNARTPVTPQPPPAVPTGADAAPPAVPAQTPMIPILMPAASPPGLEDEAAADSDLIPVELPDRTAETKPGASAGETIAKASASGVKTSPGEAAIGQAAARIAIPEAKSDTAPEIPGAPHARPMAGTEASGSLSGAAPSSASIPAANSQTAHMSAPPATLQVYTRFIERFDGRAQRFEIRLDPAELGQIDVRIEVGSDKKVRAVLAAHDSAALNDLMRGQRALERMLTDAGVDLAEGGVTFEMADDQGRNATSEDGRPAPARPDVWRRFSTIDVPVETPVERAARPWLPTRLDLVA